MSSVCVVVFAISLSLALVIVLALAVVLVIVLALAVVVVVVGTVLWCGTTQSCRSSRRRRTRHSRFFYDRYKSSNAITAFFLHLRLAASLSNIPPSHVMIDEDTDAAKDGAPVRIGLDWYCSRTTRTGDRRKVKRIVRCLLTTRNNTSTSLTGGGGLFEDTTSHSGVLYPPVPQYYY